MEIWPSYKEGLPNCKEHDLRPTKYRVYFGNHVIYVDIKAQYCLKCNGLWLDGDKARMLQDRVCELTSSRFNPKKAWYCRLYNKVCRKIVRLAMEQLC